MTTTNRPKLDRPCPTWCTSPAGHDWDSAPAENLLSRGHSGPVTSGQDVDGKGWDLAIGATEFADADITWDDDEGWELLPGAKVASSIFDPTQIDIEVMGRLDSAQARILAAALIEAADLLDGLS